MPSNLAASHANSFGERTLFDFVPCSVNAILIDENRRLRLRDVSLLGVRVISKLRSVSYDLSPHKQAQHRQTESIILLLF